MAQRIAVESEITGKVWKIEVAVGTQVQEEDTLLILESMKMEIPVMAPAAGRVAEIAVKVDDTVEEGQVLAVIET